ncbi:response regulator [Puniceicoccales bacterium CK1056]|uniref:Response regulator n=1 Tax=Oceanipulchritudo coccoides TaxID=2706888 RepID=A0A6B2M418_9BACT|nr:SpoIIE family protein phosphatase [Oceanipulchritudo coccoides]NDV63503.1 response regulator [Oceanipulchritudo coccoides]
MTEITGRSPAVLVVEDDPHGLSFMVSSLSLSGFRVISAQSITEARRQCESESLAQLWAILCDYRLPDGNGIEFLKWVHAEDPNLAFLIITGQGEKAIVQSALTGGAFHYLEKPVTHRELQRVMKDAVVDTQRLRQSVLDRQGLRDLKQFDQKMNSRIPEELSDRVQIFYQPLHEVGGDFFITHSKSPGEWVLLVGDVSGHEIKSGFVSTYIQGMFRGCLENGCPVQEFLELSNSTLRKRGFSQSLDEDVISLSCSTFYIPPSGTSICHWNFGFTPCYVVSETGRIQTGDSGKFPLGWMEEIDVADVRIPIKGNAQLIIFTDGLPEFADELKVNAFSLLYALMHGQKSIYDLPISPKDDILVLSYSLKSQIPLNSQFQPVLSEHYAGTEVEHIDHLQSNWRRSISFALEDKLGDRLYDLLICIREGMLNAFIHGCEKAPDKFAHLQISISPEKDRLRIVIDDPGRGHSFDLKKRLEDIGHTGSQHLGLGIIQHLSDEFHLENKGTSLVFDFEISPVPA